MGAAREQQRKRNRERDRDDHADRTPALAPHRRPAFLVEVEVTGLGLPDHSTFAQPPQDHSRLDPELLERARVVVVDRTGGANPGDHPAFLGEDHGYDSIHV